MVFTSLLALPDLLDPPHYLDPSAVIVLPVSPIPGSRPKNCVLNVQEYIKLNGGEPQFGWIFSSLGNVLIRFVGHCVVRTRDGLLLCVTPPEQAKVTRIGFIPDNALKPILRGVERLPAYTEVLIRNPIAKEYAKLENAKNEIICKYPARVSLSDDRLTTPLSDEDAQSMTEINHRLFEILPRLEMIVSRFQGVNQQCFCGSGRKYKKCCMANF